MGWRIVASAIVLLALESSAGVIKKKVDKATLLTHKDVYKMNPDGSYSYRYELSDGTFQHAKSDAQSEVEGGYGYRTAEGEPLKIIYTAGKFGYRPQASGVRLPALIPIGNHKVTKSKDAMFYNAKVEDPLFEEVADASYAFGYNADSLVRVEQSDEFGVTHGHYNLISPAGNTITVKYMASKETGFVIENAGELAKFVQESTLEESEAVKAKVYSGEVADIHFQDGEIDPEDWIKSKSYSYGYESSHGSRHEESDTDGNVKGSYVLYGADGSEVIVHYRAGANIGFVIDNMEEVLLKTTAAAEHDYHHEMGKDDDTQFVSVGVQTVQGPRRKPQTIKYHHVETSKVSPSVVAYGLAEKQSVKDYHSNKKVAEKIEYKPYDFRVQGESATHHETADAEGFVQGEYSYTNELGNVIRVAYKSGPEIGFVIENQEELDQSVRKATLDAAEAFEANTKKQLKPESYESETADRKNNDEESKLEQPYSIQKHQFVKAVHADSHNHVGVEFASTDEKQQNDANLAQVVDAQSKEDFEYKPYGFQIEGDSASHHEQADAEGFVRGEYSYTNELGNVIRVQYRAGPGIGFIIENQEELVESVHKATLDAAAHFEANADKKKVELKASKVKFAAKKPEGEHIIKKVKYHKKPQTLVDKEQHAAEHHVKYAQAVAEPVEEVFEYKPYEFKIEGESAAHHEQADAEGFVRGEYSYTNELGNVIKVQYKAGPGIGFVIENQEELMQSIHKATLDAAEHFEANADEKKVELKASKVKIEAKKPEAEHIVKKDHYHPKLETPIVKDAREPLAAVHHVKYTENVAEPAEEVFEYKPYGFKIEGESAAHHEQADAEGFVRGEYSYTNELGNVIKVQYKAGPGIGFVIENQEELDQSVHQATLDAAAAYESSKEQEEQNHHEEATSNTASVTSTVYTLDRSHASPSHSFVVAPQIIQDPSNVKVAALSAESHAAVSEYSNTQENEEVVYSPYNFEYQGEASNRFEQADEFGIVRGQYSYINDLGNEITVKYSAGPNQGFVIENQKELDKHVDAAVHSAALAAAKAQADAETKSMLDLKHSAKTATKHYQQGPAPQQGVVPSQASFSPVKNSFDVSSDGRRRKVVIKKVRKPILKTVAYPVSVAQPTVAVVGNFVPVPAPLPVVPLSKSSYKQHNFEHSDAHSHNEEANHEDWDASYSFSYSGKDLSHQESSDYYGERTGSYSYISPEGHNVVVKYKAGKNGFEILNPEDLAQLY